MVAEFRSRGENSPPPFRPRTIVAMVNVPFDGVMSGCCTNQSALLDELRLVAHTWTVPVDSPPVTVAVNVCAAVARVVSMIVL